MSGEAPPGERIGACFRLGKLAPEALDDPDRAEAIAFALAANYVGQDQNLAVPYYDLV